MPVCPGLSDPLALIQRHQRPDLVIRFIKTFSPNCQTGALDETGGLKQDNRKVVIPGRLSGPARAGSAGRSQG